MQGYGATGMRPLFWIDSLDQLNFNAKVGRLLFCEVEVKMRIRCGN